MASGDQDQDLSTPAIVGFSQKVDPEREIQYFYGDLVYRIGKRGLEFGMVVENSEYATDVESEDDEEEPRLKKGTIRVAWHPKGNELVVKERRVSLADRSLMPGDVVRKWSGTKGKDTQRGQCKDVSVNVCLQVVGTEQVIYGIPSNLLKPVDEFTIDVAVSFGGWVGMIRQIRSKITVSFQDGSSCVLPDTIANELEDVQDKRDLESEYRRYGYFKGQLLCGPLRVFKNGGQFINRSVELSTLMENTKTHHKIVTAVVTKVETSTLGVQWQCQGSLSGDVDLAQPEALVYGDNLKKVKMLNVFEPCTIQVGDRRFYTLKDDDIIMSRDEWKNFEQDQLANQNNNQEKSEKHIRPSSGKSSSSESENESAPAVQSRRRVIRRRRTSSGAGTLPNSTASFSTGRGVAKSKKLKPSKKAERSAPIMLDLKSGDEVCVEVVATRSEANIVWQSGEIENRIQSTELYPIIHLDDQEYFCGDFVVANSNIAGSDPRSYGIVESVDHIGRTCKVNWFRTYNCGNDPKEPETMGHSEEPVYDLKDHPDFKYRPGSIVIRVASCPEGNNKEGNTEGVGGQVLESFPSGKVSVWWSNGVTSDCWPQDLFKIGEYDSDEGELWDEEDILTESENGSESGSWETESEQSLSDENPKPENSSEEAKDGEMKPSLAASIGKAHKAMKIIEEMFNENPSGLASMSIARQLLEIHRGCRVLDWRLKTRYFVDENFGVLLEQIKRVNSRQHAMTDQYNRLFLSKSGHEAAENSSGDEDLSLNQICAKMCQKLKEQLQQVHLEAIKRLGDQSSSFTPNDLEVNPTEDDLDLAEVMNRILRVKNEEADVGGDDGKKINRSVSNQEIAAALHGKMEDNGILSMMEHVPPEHKFKMSIYTPSNPKSVVKFVRKEIKLMKESLPPGILVKGFEDRMDLYSVMIKGPANTPYEDGLFFFDFMLSEDYPSSPPSCHYHSYCGNDRLNPNLYGDGKVCVSLLGTWSGKGTETWTDNSNMLQLLVSIQGLILVSEPYYNEAGYERQKGTQQGIENSRMYNEMACLKLVHAMTLLAQRPSEAFKSEIQEHFKARAQGFVDRIELWRSFSQKLHGEASTESVQKAAEEPNLKMPEFPLLPASRGFCISVGKALKSFKSAVSSMGISIS